MAQKKTLKYGLDLRWIKVSVTTDPVNVYKWLVYHDIKLIYIMILSIQRGDGKAPAT